MSYAEKTEPGRRLIGLIAILSMHAVVIYALVHGLARKTVDVVHNPVEAKIVEEVKAPPQKPPPPAPPKLTAPPPVYIPPPQVTVQTPVTPPPIAAVTTVKPAEAPAPASAGTGPPDAPPGPPRTIVRTPAVVDPKACEKPVYPSASIRGNETGVVLLSFLIDVNGTVLEGKVERSSGYRRLDEAARAGLALCRFKPATVDGKPERSWARIEYEWKLQ